VFDNVNEAEFHGTEYDKIVGVISQEGEKLKVYNVLIALTEYKYNEELMCYS